VRTNVYLAPKAALSREEYEPSGHTVFWSTGLPLTQVLMSGIKNGDALSAAAFFLSRHCVIR
jgi:hypothetical protein